MNLELGIRLQAYLDGELNDGDEQNVVALLEGNGEARALFQELKQTRSLLRSNEAEFRLPESREFFWGKIEKEISRIEAAPAGQRRPVWMRFLVRHFAAIAGTSAAAALVLFLGLQMNFVSTGMFEEIDNPLEDTGSFSFRSESQQMTLVWIANPFADADENIEAVSPDIQ